MPTDHNTAKDSASPDGDERKMAAGRVDSIPALHEHAMVFILKGEDLIYESADDAYLNAVGGRDIIGRRIGDVFPEIDQGGGADRLRDIMRNGRTVYSSRTPVSFRRFEGGPMEDRLIDFVHQPILDESGQPTGLMVICCDVTDLPTETADGRPVEDDASASVTVLDAAGSISMVNAPWPGSGTCLGSVARLVREGANLLAICDLAASQGMVDAGRMAALVRSVIGGQKSRGRIEYEMDMDDCHRWFCVTANAFQGQEAYSIVVTHEDITQQRMSERRLAFLATHDPLTELPNRYLLENRADSLLEKARQTDGRVSVLFIDIEPFRHLSDVRSRFIDDSILQSLAAQLRLAAPQAHTIARMGGDQFVMLVADQPDVGKTAEAIGLAVSLRLMGPIQGGGRDISLKAHVGISVWPHDGDTFEELLRNAEAALAETRLSGSPSVTFYSAEMGLRLRERAQIEGELRQAVRLGQLRLEYQPQLNLKDGRLTGLEALVRWTHPTLGEISPDRFITIAETTGLITEIGDWVVATAAEQLAACADLAGCRVGVNVSPAQLRHFAFVGHVATVLRNSGLAPERLELEITENIYLSDAAITATLDGLKALGLSIAIDDFGTGYSNLSSLRRMDIDRLKIDPSFVKDLPELEHAASVAEAIVTMGKSLGLQVIAEGVETEDQARFLSDIGCDEVQGYLYGKAMPLAEVAHWNATRLGMGERGGRHGG